MSELTLQERVESVERHNKRLKVGMLAVLAAVGGLLFVGATEPVAKVVRAQKFEVVDSEGNVRVGVTTAGGSAGLYVKDKDGKLRLRMGAGMGLTDAGQPSLSMRDKDGNLRVALSVEDDGRPMLGLSNKDGRPRVLLWVDEDGSPGLVLSDKDEKFVAMLRVFDDVGPRLVLSDKDGKVIWKAP